mgnify:CR=1 FL=1
MKSEGKKNNENKIQMKDRCCGILDFFVIHLEVFLVQNCDFFFLIVINLNMKVL